VSEPAASSRLQKQKPGCWGLVFSEYLVDTFTSHLDWRLHLILFNVSTFPMIEDYRKKSFIQIHKMKIMLKDFRRPENRGDIAGITALGL